MVQRRKRPTAASQYCVRGTNSLLYQREHSATRWDGALELGVNYMGKPTTPVPLRRGDNDALGERKAIPRVLAQFMAAG